MPDPARAWRTALAVAAFVAAYAALGLATTNSYYLTILTLALVWAILGVSWNILGGYAGQVSFGHAAFFGLGAYSVALLQNRYGVSPLIGLPAGIAAATAAGWLIGLACFRLQGAYFSLAMLAFPFVLMNLFEWFGLHEMTLPLERVHPGWFLQFADHRWLLLVTLAALAVTLLICEAIGGSQFGIELKALREDELAAGTAGVDTQHHKMIAMLVSAAIAGAAGGLYMVVLGVITPAGVFGLLTSAQALVVTLFGGVGALWGPVVGALVLIPLSELLYAWFGGQVPGIQGVLFGGAIVAAVLLAPEGILWRIADWSARPPAPRTPPPLPATPPRPAAATPAPLLLVAALSRSFGGLQAVQAASFEVPAASVTGIIGPNGAGKSTLFNLLNGITAPDSGTIVFRGRSLVGLRPQQICRLGIGRTFQVPRLLARMTLLENVMVSAGAAPPGSAPPAALAWQALSAVGLAHAAPLLAASLGMRDARLLELARALASLPELILMDEPLAGLGQTEIAAMVAIIKALARTGPAVLIIEHTMQAMLQLADRLIVLDHGMVVASGAPYEIVNDPVVIDAYLGRAWGSEYADA